MSASILTCRSGFESALVDECGASTATGEGFIQLDAALPARPLIFERQRLVHAQCLTADQVKPLSPEIAEQVLRQVVQQDGLWTTHAFCSDAALSSKVEGFERALMRLCRKLDTGTFKCWRKPEKLITRNTGLVLQIFYTPDALWFSTAPIESMFDPYPGGVRRMKMDSASPSRSYLKLEEAFSYLGREPQAGEVVVDLGAAPGGWSHACLKRGAQVLAIDNGPMKLEHEDLTHLRHDGLSFVPDMQVDWLVSDMLVPPGKMISLLRNWVGKARARYFVFNVKIPQEEAYPAIEPLRAYLAGTGADIRLKQLYHDRREITGFGSLDTASTSADASTAG